MLITTFPSLYVTEGQRQDVLDLEKWLAIEFIVRKKDDLPRWSPAIFAGDRRALANVVSLGALVLDYDSGLTPLDDAVTAWRGHLGCAHTTFSSTPEAPRYRVVLELARRVNAEEYGVLWRWARERADRLGHAIDTAAKDASRIWARPGHLAATPAPLFRAWKAPALDPDWILSSAKKSVVSPMPTTPRITLDSADASTAFSRAQQYLAAIPPAVSGQHGHTQLFAACIRLVRGFALPVDVAYSLLASDYNPRCQPPWSEKELKRKVQQAADKGQMDLGELLAKKSPHGGGGAMRGDLGRLEREKSNRRTHSARVPLPPQEKNPLMTGQRHEGIPEMPRSIEETDPTISAPSDSQEKKTPRILLPQKPALGDEGHGKDTDYDLTLPPCTDEGNAERLLGRYGRILRYTPEWSTWLVWQDSHWERDPGHIVHTACIETVRASYAQAHEIEDEKTRDAFAGFLRSSENAQRVRSMKTHAALNPAVYVAASEWDKNKYVYNAKNGTLDLLTGELRPHRRGDFLSHLSDIEFQPDRSAPKFQNFLDQIFDGDDQLIESLQRFLGYCLTGDVSEHVMLVCHGEGANGKSTLLQLVQRILGPYATTADPALILPSTSRDDDMKQAVGLVGKRFAVIAESNESRRMDTGRLKALTGGDQLRVRNLYERAYIVDPTCKLVLACNHKPDVRAGDHGTWRRLILFPFLRTFKEHERDLQLSQKLWEEREGVFAWMVAGCKKWKELGLVIPEAAKKAADEWRDDGNTIQEFLADCTEKDDAFTCLSRPLFAKYTEWCEREKRPFPNSTQFGKAMSRAGYSRLKLSGGDRAWRGLRMKEPPPVVRSWRRDGA